MSKAKKGMKTMTLVKHDLKHIGDRHYKRGDCLSIEFKQKPLGIEMIMLREVLALMDAEIVSASNVTVTTDLPFATFSQLDADASFPRVGEALAQAEQEKKDRLAHNAKLNKERRDQEHRQALEQERAYHESEKRSQERALEIEAEQRAEIIARREATALP